MKNKEVIIIIILTLIISFMDISGIPSVLLFDIKIADIDTFIFPLLLNFMLIGILTFLVLKFLCPSWRLGLSTDGLWNGIKRYSIAGIVAGALSCAAFYIGLSPFDYEPTIWKILFEGILYYVGVGMIEELYVRGLFLNVVEKLAYKSKNRTNIAIWVSSVVFGLGHIPGTIGMGVFVITCKVVVTIGMGLYFGTIYKKTGNLWLPSIMHIFIDICAMPYCFTTFRGYKTISLILLAAIFIALGSYSLFLMRKKASKSIEPQNFRSG